MLKTSPAAALARGLAGCLGLLACAASGADPGPTRVCFVYVSPIGQAGWTYQHERARLALERAMPGEVATRFVESVPEGPDSERVMRDFAQQGCALIYATSFGYLESALRVAAEFPAVKFEHAGGYKMAPNLGTYEARFYEGRWLAGYLAGRSSRTGVAGYVAGFPVPEVVQGINAFTLGMRAADPKATVRVLWLDTWFDPPKEREAAIALVNAGADVLTYHSASPAVPQAAQERGVRLLAYHSDMRAVAPDAQLAAVSADWSGPVIAAARAVRAGTWSAKARSGGLADGTVRFGAFHPSLPADVRQALAQREREIADGRRAVFAAPLVDNGGRTRLAQGALAPAAIAGMDWLVQGVVGTLPSR
jgi:simple sugar transport system substrate-binding protein